MTPPLVPASPQTPDGLGAPLDGFKDAVGYWERRRVLYNLALLSLATAWVVLTWPHFQPAFTLDALGKVLVLAALANVCYCAAYIVEFALQGSSAWRRRRGALWLLGTLFAVAVAWYWIADEIYPDVR